MNEAREGLTACSQNLFSSGSQHLIDLVWDTLWWIPFGRSSYSRNISYRGRKMWHAKPQKMAGDLKYASPTSNLKEKNNVSCNYKQLYKLFDFIIKTSQKFHPLTNNLTKKVFNPFGKDKEQDFHFVTILQRNKNKLHRNKTFCLLVSALGNVCALPVLLVSASSPLWWALREARWSSAHIKILIYQH
jgi:hypothetical protein